MIADIHLLCLHSMVLIKVKEFPPEPNTITLNLISNVKAVQRNEDIKYLLRKKLIFHTIFIFSAVGFILIKL